MNYKALSIAGPNFSSLSIVEYQIPAEKQSTCLYIYKYIEGGRGEGNTKDRICSILKLEINQ